MRRNFIIVWIIMTVMCMGAGIVTRMSFKNYAELKKDKMDSFIAAVNPINEESVNKEISEIEKKAEVIVRIKCVGEREYLHEAVLSKVEITEVYKGGENILFNDNDRYIYVYEPCFFNFEKEYFMSVGAYNLMRENEEYILYLNRKDFPPEYKLSEKEGKEYVLTTHDTFSNYPVSQEYQVKIVGEEEELAYGEIKNYEALFREVEMLELYDAFKTKLFQGIQ